MAELVLVSALERPELRLLGTAPDNIFALISFAAAFLIMAKISIYQNHGEHLQGSVDKLLTKIVEHLSEAAYAPDHTPAKCAQLISALLGTWERRVSKPDGGAPVVHAAVSREHLSPIKSTEPELLVPSHKQLQSDLFTSVGSDFDFDQFMNSDIFLDTEFWASFMVNLSTATGS